MMRQETKRTTPMPLNSKIHIWAVCSWILHSDENPSLGRIELAAARHAHITILALLTMVPYLRTKRSPADELTTTAPILRNGTPGLGP
jgi:hypothetical protein